MMEEAAGDAFYRHAAYSALLCIGLAAVLLGLNAGLRLRLGFAFDPLPSLNYLAIIAAASLAPFALPAHLRRWFHRRPPALALLPLAVLLALPMLAWIAGPWAILLFAGIGIAGLPACLRHFLCFSPSQRRWLGAIALLGGAYVFFCNSTLQVSYLAADASNPKDVCLRAAARGIQRVFILRSAYRPEANALLDCLTGAPSPAEAKG